LDNSLPTLVIVCKRPALYQGKQRLAATVGAEAAFIFAEHFLACALEDARQWPGTVVLSPSVEEDLAWARELLPGLTRVLPQPEGNLGERLKAIDQRLRALGDQQILFIGTDAPALSSVHYQAAIKAFAAHQVVLSAASDGGVTMMGSRGGWPDLARLPWSTERLGEALHDSCVEQGLVTTYISPSYDIDVEEDLWRLFDELISDTRSARKALRRAITTFLDKDENLYARSGKRVLR
jgi:hypothetical protein